MSPCGEWLIFEATLRSKRNCVLCGPLSASLDRSIGRKMLLSKVNGLV
jgi:hypothetical protein